MRGAKRAAGVAEGPGRVGGRGVKSPGQRRLLEGSLGWWAGGLSLVGQVRHPWPWVGWVS